jgi:hypothetical protein
VIGYLKLQNGTSTFLKDRRQSVLMDLTQPIGGILMKESRPLSPIQEEIEKSSSSRSSSSSSGSSDSLLVDDRRKSVPMDLTTNLSRILTPTKNDKSNVTISSKNTPIIQKTSNGPLVSNEDEIRTQYHPITMELTQPVGGILPGPTLDKSLDDDTNEIYPKTPLTDRTRRISIPMDLTQPIGGILSNENKNKTDSGEVRGVCLFVCLFVLTHNLKNLIVWFDT